MRYFSTSNGIDKPKLSKYSHTSSSIFLQQTQWVPGPEKSSRFIVPHSSFLILFGRLSLENTPLNFFIPNSLTNLFKSILDKGFSMFRSLARASLSRDFIAAGRSAAIILFRLLEYCWTDCFSLEEDLCLFFYVSQFLEHKFLLCLMLSEV